MKADQTNFSSRHHLWQLRNWNVENRFDIDKHLQQFFRCSKVLFISPASLTADPWLLWSFCCISFSHCCALHCNLVHRLFPLQCRACTMYNVHCTYIVHVHCCTIFLTTEKEWKRSSCWATNYVAACYAALSTISWHPHSAVKGIIQCLPIM